MDVVVVLPCVPATASTWRPCSTFSSNHCGPLVYGKPASRMASISGNLGAPSGSRARLTTLPTTNTSGFSASWSAP